MRISQVIAYLLLLPGLGVFYFSLMVIGGISIGPFELEDLRIFGGPSLANLIEIPIAGIFGLIAAISFAIFQKLNFEK